MRRKKEPHGACGLCFWTSYKKSSCLFSRSWHVYSQKDYLYNPFELGMRTFHFKTRYTYVQGFFFFFSSLFPSPLMNINRNLSAIVFIVFGHRPLVADAITSTDLLDGLSILFFSFPFFSSYFFLSFLSISIIYSRFILFYIFLVKPPPFYSIDTLLLAREVFTSLR